MSDDWNGFCFELTERDDRPIRHWEIEIVILRGQAMTVLVLETSSLDH